MKLIGILPVRMNYCSVNVGMNDKTVNLISEWMIFAIESSKDKDKIEKYL